MWVCGAVGGVGIRNFVGEIEHHRGSPPPPCPGTHPPLPLRDSEYGLTVSTHQPEYQS